MCVALLVSAVPALLVVAAISNPNAVSWPALLFVLALQAGSLAWAAGAWRRLRRASESSPIEIADVERIREIVAGPFGPLRTWLRRICAVAIAIAVLCLLARALGT